MAASSAGSGTVITPPHFLHFAFTPALSAGTLYFCPHDGQLK